MITKSDGELLRGGGRSRHLRDGQNKFQDEEGDAHIHWDQEAKPRHWHV